MQIFADYDYAGYLLALIIPHFSSLVSACLCVLFCLTYMHVMQRATNKKMNDNVLFNIVGHTVVAHIIMRITDKSVNVSEVSERVGYFLYLFR